MAELKDLLQSADWKKEKHVPVIDGPSSAKKGEAVRITVTVGKGIAHPNTTSHHIAFLAVYFLPDGEKFPYQVARAEFASHGASAQGPDTSGVYANPEIIFSFKTDKPGALLATSYCNIHGLWESSKKLETA
jgi:superoxide reductase